MKVNIVTETVKMRQVTGTDYIKPQFTYETEKQIDWNDSSDRKWLVSHLHWAMSNGHKVTITSNDAYTKFWESQRANNAATNDRSDNPSHESI